MINLRELVTAMADTLASIPELIQVLAPIDPVVGYVDQNPKRNSVSAARYQMQPGSVMVAWLETRFLEGEIQPWSHVVEIFVKALKEQSDFDVVDRIVNGVPMPGDGQIWRRCAVMPGVLPTQITNINRVTDEEQLDSVTITTETLEVGDYTPAWAAKQEEASENGNDT